MKSDGRLGIDMGGSGTRAHLLRGAGEVRDWRADGGNVALDPEAALDVLAGIISAAAPGAACLGLAGARTAPEAAAWLQHELATLVPRVTVMSDAELALLAGHGPTADGVVVCAGTGSVAVVRVDGHTHILGGHGYLFDDAGSAYAIGRNGLAAALRSRDRGELELGMLVEDLLGEPLDAYLARIYRSSEPRTPVAALARHVSVMDHPTAREIIDRAADDLVELATTARTRFGPALPVRYSGGVFSIRAVAAQMERALEARAVTVRPEVAAAQFAGTT